MDQLEVQPISIRHLRAIAIETYKKLKGKSAIEDHILEYINHSANTRAANRRDLKVVATKKDNLKFSFGGVALKVYNQLSKKTRAFKTLSEFKSGFDNDVSQYEVCCTKIFRK